MYIMLINNTFSNTCPMVTRLFIQITDGLPPQKVMETGFSSALVYFHYIVNILLHRGLFLYCHMVNCIIIYV